MGFALKRPDFQFQFLFFWAVGLGLALPSSPVYGACGVTTYTWQPNANTTVWTTTNNWSPVGVPDANTENAYIQADWQVPAWPAASYTLSCLQIASGAMTATPAAARTLTIIGDYFKNPNPGSLTTNANFTIIMAGTAAQTFENVDSVNNLTISNSTTTALSQAFTVSGNFTINAGAGTIQVQSGLSLTNAAAAITIPASATLDVQSGATLVAMGGITVNGTLKVGAGASVLIGNGKNLTVNAGGVLQLNGTSGNAAILDADSGGSTYAVTVAGSLNANYFSISRTTAPGINVTGTVQALSNGDFHYLASGGYAVTLATAVNIPSPNPSGLGFFDDFAYANTRNFNATAYTGSVFTVSNWSGLGGAGNETDPANKITWGSQAPMALQITNRTASGNPATTIIKGSAATLFATFAFSLNGTGTASDITSVTFTLAGNNLVSDVAYAQVMNDTNGNCTYQAGTDLQIGANLYFAGSTPTTTVTIPASTVTVSNTSLKCVHVLLVTNANALTGDTLQIKVAGTTDVVNSQGYSFSNTSGPPVKGSSSTITGTAIKIWGGGFGPNAGAQNWNANAGDWAPAGTPVSTSDCQVGPGYSYPSINGNYTCTNLLLPDLGKMTWGGTANTLTLLGGLELGTGYTFLTSVTGNLSFASTVASQSILAQTTFPGNVVINNTAATNPTVSVNSNWTIGGNLTLTAGILRITPGVNLTVLGTITVNGGTLMIDPGATLTLGDGRTLTVNALGTLEIVGSAAQNAAFTCAGIATGCAVVITGTIKAQYYTFSKLAVAGLTINGGATVDATYYMQNGSFTYPVGTNPILLTLNRQIPGNALGSMTFDKAGSAATGTKSILTSAAAGTLTVSNYSGDLTNCCTTAPTYLVSWTSPTTTLKLTSEGLSGVVTIAIAVPGVVTWNAHGLNAGAAVQFSTTGALPTGLVAATTYYVAAAPAPTANTFSVSATSGGAAINTTGTQSGVHSISAGVNNANQGDTSVRAGWFGFQQTQVGSFADTNITSVKITLDGTGSASDVGSARLYYDSACSGTGGTQVGSALTFTGSPPTLTFSGLTGVIVQSSLVSPPKRCIYVEYDVASTATAGATLVAKIASSAHVVNSQSYSFNGSFAPPASGRTITVIGSTITWTGTTSTAWNVATNWSPNTVIPDATKNCVINSAVRNPIISAAGAICKSLTIGNGTLTINTGQNLDVYGSITNTGTITQASATATISVRDNGAVPTNNTLQSSSALNYLVFNKTAGGYVYIGNNNLTINNFVITAGKTFTFNVRNGDILTLPNGAAISSATFLVDSGATVAISNAQTFTVSGATFRIAGTNDGYPQSLSNKGTMTRNGGSGTWSFVATSGTLNLTGWVMAWLDCNGLQVNGTTTLSTLNGGQFTDLPATGTCGGTLKALQLNTTGTLPATADYVGFNWGAGNSPPTVATAYWLVFSSGCANQTTSFTNWFGDFFVAVDFPVVQSKVSNTTCNATMTAAASPVTLTKFQAIPYDGSVLVDWITGLEILHSGFNVYRSEDPEFGAVQINPVMLRNPLATGTVHGHYQFFDRTVANARTYYYWIEDISTTGQRKRHGPLPATPFAFLGPAPAAQSSAITGSQGGSTPSATAQANSFAPGQVELAPGVTLLAYTTHSLRVRIDVAPLKRAPAVFPYEHIAIDGYSVGGTAGRAENLERTLYLQIPKLAEATFKLVDQKSITVSPISISPNPEWVLENGALGPKPAFDANFYAATEFTPSSPVQLGKAVESSDKISLPVTIFPLRYSAGSRTAEVATQIIFDVFLGPAPAWNSGAAPEASGPYGLEGGLKIRIAKTGLYQLSFDDLVSAGVEGPFWRGDSAKLRLFRDLVELPIEVSSVSGTFSSGDFIRFFAPYFESAESAHNTLVLYLDSVVGKRMARISGVPVGTPSSQRYFNKRVTLEKASFGFFNEPYGEGLDHILWGRFYSPPHTPGEEKISTVVSLPSLIAQGSVTVKVYVKGGAGVRIKNPVHHLRLKVNGIAVGDDEFQTNEPHVSLFEVAANRFVATQNAIDLEAVGDLVGGDYDIINLDRIVVDYPHDWLAEEGIAEFLNYQTGSTLTIGGFTSSHIQLYDITHADSLTIVDGVVTSVTEAGNQIQFGTVTGNPTLGRRFWAVENGVVPRPASIELNVGSNLVATDQGADVLYLGPAKLLGAISPLAEYRKSQGFRTALVDLEKIYMEFGKGAESSVAIKEFIKYVVTHWQSPAPKYVVLVGDGTYDPKNQLHYNPKGVLPVHLSKGLYADYGNDNWYVSLDDESDAPHLAIGRIPGGTPELIQAYVEKVIRFERGVARPTGVAANQITLISDQDQLGGEHFHAKADSLASQITASKSGLVVNRLLRGSQSDEDLKQKLVAAFSAGSAFIHFMGHGAEDRWAAAEFFQNADAEKLDNKTLPIIVAMNCLNTYFYDADPAFRSLAERLIFNPTGGAIAFWGSTSMTSPDLQEPFQKALYQILAEGSMRLGDAIRLAKNRGGVSLGTADIIRSWTLLGDPMLQVSQSAKGEPRSEQRASAGSCASVHQIGNRPELPGWGMLLNLLTLVGALFFGRRYRRKYVA